MPIYEYECGACGHRFENLQEMSAAAPDCPKCKGKVKKLLSAATPISGGPSRSSSCGGDRSSCASAPCCGGKCGGH
jgi:putative FmdB family regulatory protein